MKLNAVGVCASNIKKSVQFYELIGFKFQPFKDEDQHVETIPETGSVKLMIDSKELIRSLINAEPTTSNHSAFAIQFDSSDEVNSVANKLKDAGFRVHKEPWDAFWGQRYAVIADPDGNLIDLYASL